MKCLTCQTDAPENAAYCTQCGTVFDKSRIEQTAIDHKHHFCSLRYMKFLFFSCKGRINRERYIIKFF